MRRILTILAPLIALARPLGAALFWEPVPLPAPDVRIYRLATDGVRLFAGGAHVGYGFYVDVELVSSDGRSWSEIPPFPLDGISLSYAAAEGGRLSKLVRISDDAAPRKYLVATWETGLGLWSTGYVLTLPGDETPGNLAVLGRVPYVGTTAGNLWTETYGGWSRVPNDLPAALAERAPRLFVTGGATYVATDSGLGLLLNGVIVPADLRLVGRRVLDAVERDGSLWVLSLADGDGGRMRVERLDAFSVETVADFEPGDARGFLFFSGGGLYVSGPWNEPRLLSEGLLLSPRAAAANSVYGFRVTTGDGTLIRFRGEMYTTSTAVLHRARERTVKTVPAAVDAGAPGGGRFFTSLLLGNYGDLPVRATVTFHPDAGRDPSLPPMSVSVAPRSEARFPDVVSSLRAAGAASPSGDFLGSLSVELDPPVPHGEFFAAARVFAARAEGTWGVTVPALPSGSGLDSVGLLPAIVADGKTRTNVAAVNAADGSALPSAHCEGACGRSPSLEIADPNGALTSTAPFTLPAGGRRQWNRLAPGEGTTGSAHLLPPGGASWDAQPNDDLLAYAVLNDETTDDGVLLPLQSPSRDALRDALFLPALGDFGGEGGVAYRSTLYLAQAPGTPPAAERLAFRFFGVGASGPIDLTFEERLPAGASRRIENLRVWLASHDPSGRLVPAAGDLLGTLRIGGGDGRLAGLAASGVIAAERPGLPGRAMTSLDALAASRWARTSAVVPGLASDEAFRANVAVANAEPPGGPDAVLGLEIRAARDGDVLAILPDVRLAPGERFQWNGVLEVASLAPGTQAWGQVVSRLARPGSARFAAYGVLVDRRTGDGSVLPMTRVK